MLKSTHYGILLGIIFLLINACNQHVEPLYTITIETPGKNGKFPFLYQNNNQTLMSWVEQRNDSSFLFFSLLENNQWSTPTLIVSGTDWFVNWADYPMIHANQKGEMIAHYLKKSAPDTYAYDIQLCYSQDGKSWESIGKLNDDSTQTEHGFVSATILTDHSFQFAWLDGRNTQNESEHTAMSLRTKSIKDGMMATSEPLDQRTCDCCQTSSATIGERSMVVYRDRSEMEIRDIYFTVQSKDGWSTPRPIFNDQWEIRGCPVNGPQVATKNNQVAVVWYTGAKGRPKVQLAFSSDIDDGFQAPIVIDDQKPLGRVDLSWISETQVAVVWMSQNENQSVINLAIADQNKGKVKEKVIAVNGPGRQTGFPQLVSVDNRLLVAWTDHDGEKSELRSQFINL